MGWLFGNKKRKQEETEECDDENIEEDDENTEDDEEEKMPESECIFQEWEEGYYDEKEDKEIDCWICTLKTDEYTRCGPVKCPMFQAWQNTKKQEVKKNGEYEKER